jgi:AcrR family transcriptional regulator
MSMAASALKYKINWLIDQMDEKRSRGRPTDPELQDRRRADLLDAALHLVAERGVEGLRTRDVAARAGVNVSTLHYWFGTKEDLLLALVGHASGQFGAPGAPGEESLREHLERAWQAFEARPQLSIVLQELSVRAQRDEATRAVFQQVFQGWNAAVEQVVRDGIARGELRADLDPAASARVLTSFIMGALLQLGIDRQAFGFQAVAAELERWTARR